MNRDEAIRLSSVNRELAAQVTRLERELEQERQDRKQADLDTIRALGERNDARKALDQERQLVASLQALATTDHESKEAFIRRCREALGINEPARFWVPGESCPECGNDLSVRDHGDGRVYDGDECRCCECAFTGYLSVDEDGQTLVHDYQADEAVDPP